MNKANNFNRAEIDAPHRSKHNLGNEHITTTSWGSLIPIYTQTLLPGDTVYYDPKIFIRTPAAQTATFGQVRVTQASFFVPTRILWDDWTDFITGGLNSTEVYTKPYILWSDLTMMSFLEGPDSKPLSIFDSDMLQTLEGLTTRYGIPYFPLFSYGHTTDLITNFGLNPYAGMSHNPSIDNTNAVRTNVQNQRIDILPFRAYQKIWWDWFRDSVLIPESLKDDYLKTDGLYQDLLWDNLSHAGSADDVSDWNNIVFSLLNQFKTRKIAYRKDYFTTAKTDPQVGSAALVPVNLANTDLNPGFNYNRFIGTDGSGTVGSVSLTSTTPPSASLVSNSTSVIGQFQLEVFRTMNALQRYTEKNMIVGTRPVNLFLARYGYAPSAARYDMAELVGGDDRYLDWVQVTSTADTSDGESGASLADVSSYGRLFFSPSKQTYTAHEHGIFISVLAIQPVVGYCDGIDKMWQLFEKEDYFTEEYENTGFEVIAEKELFAPGFRTSLVNGDDYGEMPNGITAQYSGDDAFGFQERYSGWKWHRDVLGGDFVRYSTSLGGDAFHTFRRFGQVPNLNPAFVDVNTLQYGNNWNRLFVDTNVDYNPFYLDINNSNNMVRPMKGFAEPTLSNLIDQNGKTINIPYGGVRM